MKRLFAFVAVALLAMSCTKQDIYSLLSANRGSYISATISGSFKNFENTEFQSNEVYFDEEQHPEFKMYEDGTFSFTFDHTLQARGGEFVYINMGWDKLEGAIELNKVYPLALLNESRAFIRVNTDNYQSKQYNAVDGWVVFTKKKVHSGGFLFTGDFRFDAVAEDGDTISVQNGVISECRICVADDYGCVAK